MVNTLEGRKQFLEEFTKRLFIVAKSRKVEMPIKKKVEIKNDSSLPVAQNFPKHIEKRINQAFNSPPPHVIPKMPVQRIGVAQNFSPSMPITREVPQPPRAPSIIVPQNLNATSTLLALDSLKKIAQLFSDPYIQSVESKGPGKQVIVLKRGMPQVTSITLTKEEIDSILKDVSEKTRIPLMQGLFKAAIENFIVTAVISEYVGTRFVIEKRMMI